jgi:hypothetical protein
MKKIFSSIMMLAMMMAAMTTLTSCEDEDDYIAQKLRDKDWQGTVDAYYSDRWGLSGSTYATVMRFESKGSWYTSGRGYEVDYDTRSPYNDYAYCSFSWCIVNRDIYLIYDDDAWSVLYILDYGLNDNAFWGDIRDSSKRRIHFDFTNSSFDGWGNYNRNGGYGDFHNQNWYRSRAQVSEDADVPFIDRTDIARQQSGETAAISVASGKFAKAIQERAGK